MACLQPELLEACKELGMPAGTKEAMADRIINHFSTEQAATKVPAATSSVVNQSVTAVRPPVPLPKAKVVPSAPVAVQLEPETGLSQRIADLDTAIAKKTEELEHLRSADKCAAALAVAVARRSSCDCRIRFGLAGVKCTAHAHRLLCRTFMSLGYGLLTRYTRCSLLRLDILLHKLSKGGDGQYMDMST
jgi:hypothetical protein